MKIWIDLKVLLMASCLLVTLQGVTAKRSGIGRRAKSSSGRSHSGRSNQQHHYAPPPAPKPVPKPVEAPKSVSNVASAPKPAAPAANQQPIGWNVGSGKQNPSAPVGPPPPYPGAGGGSHYYPGIGGAPPAYSPRNAHPPSYSSLNHGQSHPHQSYSPYQQQHSPQMSHAADSSRHYGLGPTNLGPSHGHNPYMQSGYGGYGGQMGGNPYAMGGHGYYPGAAAGGFGGMGASPMMGMGGMGGMGGGLYGGYQKPKSSLFSLSNILTGVALYGTVRSLSGGGWGGGGYGSGYGYGGPKEVHIYDHRDHGKDTAENTAIQQAIGIPGTSNITYTANTPTPLAPYPAATGPDVPAEAPSEPVEELTLPPLPADSQPKIYYGYGFAYGYGDYSVDSETSKSSKEEVTEGNTSQKPSTSLSSLSSEEKEENMLDTTTELSEENTSQESLEPDS